MEMFETQPTQLRKCMTIKWSCKKNISLDPYKSDDFRKGTVNFLKRKEG